MGQYHVTVNWDKKECLYPHQLGLGLKTGEQCGHILGMGDFIFPLLVAPENRGGGDIQHYGRNDPDKVFYGRWHGDHVAVIGDYAEDADLPESWEAGKIFDWCSDAQEQALAKWEGPEQKDFQLIRTDTGWADITPLLIPFYEELYHFRLCGEKGSWMGRAFDPQHWDWMFKGDPAEKKANKICWETRQDYYKVYWPLKRQHDAAKAARNEQRIVKAMLAGVD